MDWNHRWKKFSDWLSMPLGQALIQEESKTISPWLQKLFGFHLLMLGEAPLLQSLNKSPIQNRFWCHLQSIKRNDCTAIISRQDKLPILSDEIDLIYLAHCLEFSKNPHEVLRETYRALKPEGYLIITGFNPWSSWGFWKILLGRLKSLPWNADFISMRRLKDWLALLGFDVLQIKTCFFKPPLERAAWLAKFSWTEKFFKFLLPFSGASYIILAQKRVATLTLIKPQWAKKPRMAAESWGEPVTRLER